MSSQASREADQQRVADALTNFTADYAASLVDDEGLAEEDLLAELEEGDEFMSDYREQRLRELKQQQAAIHDLKAKDFGEYTELADEKEFLALTTSTPRVVVHFYKEGFERCRIMDMHMQKLARKHFGVKFAKLDVEKAPFFVLKLVLKVLPTVVAFQDGVVLDRMTGFEAFGEQLPDDFKTEIIEKRFFKCGLFTAKTSKAPSNNSDEDSEDEDDPSRRKRGIW